MASAEHQAIAQAIDLALRGIEDSALVGVFESERRKFDYSCLLKRDLTRPLVAQVLWGHEEGLEKDIRTLLFDRESKLKLYVLKDKLGIRATLDDVLSSYRSHDDTRSRLAGLRLLFIPTDFDADSEKERTWLNDFVRMALLKDLGFAIIFGGMTRHVVMTFMNHQGPFGLKYAILLEISNNGLVHTPTFKKRLGYSTTGTIREVLTMLNATGLVRNWPSSVCYFPTIRGRLMLDLTRRLLVESKRSKDWSNETRIFFRALDISVPEFRNVDDVSPRRVRSILFESVPCQVLRNPIPQTSFGRSGSRPA
ncbi:MAG: hypothetical protein ABSD75_34295 [Terriglobales bacterium]|jgi:hypothetical protein